MALIETSLANIGRIGMGAVFLFTILIDLKTRPTIFNMMKQKNVPAPWLCYAGAIIWKAVTSLGVLLNIYPFWSSLLLAIYIFIANCIFNNFWAVPAKQRDFSFVMFLAYLSVCFGLLTIGSTGACMNY